nr:MAG: RNA-dependent RNA polymerase [Tolviot virus]
MDADCENIEFEFDPDNYYGLSEEDREYYGLNSGKRGENLSIVTNNSFVPGHLASPIYEEEVNFILENIDSTFFCKRHKQLQAKFKTYKRRHNLTNLTYDPLGWLQNWIKTNAYYRTRSIDEIVELIDCWVIQKLCYMQPTFSLEENSRQRIQQVLESQVVEIKRKMKVLDDDFISMLQVEEIKDSICFKNIAYGKFKTYGSLNCERDLSFIIDNYDKDMILIFPTSLLLCALDKLQCTFPLKAMWVISDVFDYYPGLSILDRGTEILDYMMNLRSRMKKGFYYVISAWQSLMVGFAANTENDLGFDKLFECQKTDMIEKFVEDGIPNEWNVFEKVMLPRNQNTIEILLHLELIGAEKMCGYPILESKHLLDSFRKYAVKNHKSIKLEVIEEVNGVIRREFCLNYYAKRNRYPKFKYVPPTLSKVLLGGKPCPTNLKKLYSEWAKVIFDKTLEYDYSPDMSELIKDSSSAVPLDAWPSMYDRCAFKIKLGKEPPYVDNLTEINKQKRTVTAFLNATEDMVREEINKRERGIYDEQQHLTVQCGKEREQKPKTGRAFSKQPFKQRLVQTSMEKNIAEKIFPFVPQQSMTDGDILSSRRTLEHVVSMKKDSVFVCLDLTKWCNNQRHITTCFAAAMYDELFGLNGLFYNSHTYFVDCTLLNNSRLDPPDFDSNGKPVEGDCCILRIQGAGEGLNQKKWTHVAEAILILALEKTGLKGSIMGQGDNQVIILDFPKGTPEDDIRSQTKGFLSCLEILMEGMNHEMKDKETWYSRYLHEYGKTRIFKGSCVRNTTKKAAILIPDSNDGLFSIPSSIATLNTMTEAIAKNDFNADTAFILNTILVTNYKYRKNLFWKKTKKNVKIASMMWPADFGGLPTSSYHTHSIRGMDDKVVLWLTILQFVKTYNPDIYENMISIWKFPKMTANNAMERGRWYEDVFCLNVDSLPSAEYEIRNFTNDYLRSDEVTNPAIKKLYERGTSYSKEQLIENLDKMQPKFVQLIHEILKDSNYGVLQHLMQKFTSVKTVEMLVQRSKKISLIELIEEKNKQLVLIYNNRLRNLNYVSNSHLFTTFDCPKKKAEELRFLSWGCESVGLSRPIHTHQIKMLKSDELTEDDIENSIIIKMSTESCQTVSNVRLQVGPFKHYIGSSTREKIKKPTISFAQTTSYEKALKNLGKNMSWCKKIGANNLTLFIQKLISEKVCHGSYKLTQEDLNEISCEITSGNILHRFMSSVQSSFAALNILPGCSSHFSQSTNLMKTKMAGGKDFDLFFQDIFVTNISVLCLHADIFGYVRPEYAAVINCHKCAEEITGVEFDLSERDNLPQVSFQNDNNAINLLSSHSFIQNLDEAMTYHVGRTIADNIDRNFFLEHNHGSFYGKLNDLSKESISLNDLRQLNLRKILIIAFLNSKHCQKLIADETDLLESFSYNRSFTYLGSIIIDGGFLGEFFNIYPIQVSEHCMITQAEKLSAFIGRGLIWFLIKNVELVKEWGSKMVYFSDLSGNNQHQVLYSILVIRYKSNDITKEEFIRVKKRITGNPQYLKYISNKKPYIVLREENDLIVSEWRRSDRSSNVTVLDRVSKENIYRPSVFLPVLCRTAYNSRRIIKEPNSFTFDCIGYMGRILGFPSTALSKYVEILYMVGFLPNNANLQGTYYALAEGSGSTFSGLMTIFKNMNGVYNTLMSETIDNRDDITDCDPPASKCIPIIENRILRYLNLNRGTTDILTEDFKTKLERTFYVKPPTIVTMDAESMSKGSNMDFVSHLLPLILSFLPKIVIFKMFHTYDLDSQINHFISDKFDWTLCKPITSNPVGYEVFLVIIRRDYSSTSDIELLKRLWDGFKNIFPQDDSLMTMSTNQISLYIDSCIEISRFFKVEFETSNLLLQSKYYPLEKSGRICSLYCKRMLYMITDVIDALDINMSSDKLYSVIRTGGKDEQMFRLVFNLIFLLKEKDTRSSGIVSLLLELNKVDINKSNFIKNKRDFKNWFSSSIFQLDGTFLRDFGEAKIYFRELIDTVKCNCLVKVRYLSSDRKMNSFSQCLIDYMYSSNFLRHTKFLEKRVEMQMDEIPNYKSLVKKYYSVSQDIIEGYYKGTKNQK